MYVEGTDVVERSHICSCYNPSIIIARREAFIKYVANRHRKKS